ncbi:unnamed protein product [Camellia sinensis]
MESKPSLLRNILVRLFVFGVLIIAVRFAYVVTIRGESCDLGSFCFFSSPENLNLVIGVQNRRSSAIISNDAALIASSATCSIPGLPTLVLASAFPGSCSIKIPYWFKEKGTGYGQIIDEVNGFQKLEKIKDSNRRSRQLEELTDKLRECKRLIKEFDRELKGLEDRNDPDTNKILNEKKQSLIKELNSYVAMKKQCASNLDNKRVELFTGPSEGIGEDNVLLASSMTNQELIDNGNQMMDETDQAIERSKKVVHDTINVGTDTAAALKAQTEQMSRIVNELDSIHFSIKKASKLVKEIGRQVATDKCIMALLFLIVLGVVTIIIVKACESTQQRHSGYPRTSPSCSESEITLEMLEVEHHYTSLLAGSWVG